MTLRKKAALCFSGQMRHVKGTFEDHIRKNLIVPNSDTYNIDVFVHTWFDKAEVGTAYMSAQGITASENIPEDVIQNVYDAYNPTKMLIEKQIDFDEKNYNSHRASKIIIKFSLSKNYSILQTSLLKQQYEKEQDFKYDVAVLLRTDVSLGVPVTFDSFDLNAYNCSPHGYVGGEGVDVAIAVMNSENFDKMAKLYDNIGAVFASGVKFADERLMHRHLEVYNVPIIRTPALSNYVLKRK